MPKLFMQCSGYQGLSLKQRHNACLLFFALAVKCYRYCCNIPLSFSLNYLLAVVWPLSIMFRQILFYAMHPSLFLLSLIIVFRHFVSVIFPTDDVHFKVLPAFYAIFHVTTCFFSVSHFIFSFIWYMQYLWDSIKYNGWKCSRYEIFGNKAKLSIQINPKSHAHTH